MIIDFHTHIFPEKLASKAKYSLTENTVRQGHPLEPLTDMTLSSLLTFMSECGIDKSVVLPVVTKPSQTVSTNEFSASCASDKIIPFGGIHPDTDDYKRDIDHICSLGLKGIKLHAEYQHFYPEEDRMLRIYDYAFEKGLIVIHHAGFDPGLPPPFHTDPRRFSEMLDKLSGGVMVLAHLGGQAQWDGVEELLCGRDVYLDTSMGFEYYSHEQFLRIVKKHGADKILFATDSPWSHSGKEKEILMSLPLTDEEKRSISGENARRLLSI